MELLESYGSTNCVTCTPTLVRKQTLVFSEKPTHIRRFVGPKNSSAFVKTPAVGNFHHFSRMKRKDTWQNYRIIMRGRKYIVCQNNTRCSHKKKPIKSLKIQGKKKKKAEQATSRTFPPLERRKLGKLISPRKKPRRTGGELQGSTRAKSNKKERGHGGLA